MSLKIVSTDSAFHHHCVNGYSRLNRLYTSKAFCFGKINDILHKIIRNGYVYSTFMLPTRNINIGSIEELQSQNFSSVELPP